MKVEGRGIAYLSFETRRQKYLSVVRIAMKPAS